MFCIYRGEITVDQPLGLLARKVSLYGVIPDGKPSVTKFIRLSYNGKSSVVKCKSVFFYHVAGRIKGEVLLGLGRNEEYNICNFIHLYGLMVSIMYLFL